MTNTELLAKIKAEIKRISSRAMNEEGQDLCEYLLSFLATLESETPKDLEEAAWGYASKECEKEAFIAGAKWDREQMMKESVEGDVVKDINNKLVVTAKNVNLDKFKFGDKVRIIIVKED